MTSPEAWETQKGDGIDQSLLKLSTLWDLGRLMLPAHTPPETDLVPFTGRGPLYGLSAMFHDALADWERK